MFSVTSMTKALLSQLLRFVMRPVLEMRKANVLSGSFSAASVFLYPSPDLCLSTILSPRSIDTYLDFMA